MAMDQYYHMLQCLNFPCDWGKVRQTKIRKLKPQYLQNEKSSLKTARIEQISEFCNKIKHLQT